MLTTVILTVDTSPSLTKTLTSVLFSDEIIIMADTTKTMTLNIDNPKIRIIYRPLNRNFAKQRNIGLSKARGDWVLFVDDDEVVTRQLQTEITKTIALSNNVQGYYLKRQDYFMGKLLRFGETGQIRLLRLARRQAGSWQRQVHEFWQIPGRTSKLAQPLLHYSHASLESMITKINLYTQIEARLRRQTSFLVVCLEIAVKPLAKFVVNYFIKLGFLDGLPGFVMALMMSWHSLVVRVKTYEHIVNKHH